MAGDTPKEQQVSRVIPGPNTGDTIYVLKDGTLIHEPLGTHRVTVLEGDIKFGPRRIRVNR